MSNCPSRWTDLASTIQVTWAAPERPNGILLRYHLQLTTYDGRRVITTESVGSGTLVGQLDTSELGECQHKCGFCLYRNFVVISQGRIQGGAWGAHAPCFGTKQALSTEVYHVLSVCSYSNTVHISIRIAANIKHSNLQLPRDSSVAVTHPRVHDDV